MAAEEEYDTSFRLNGNSFAEMSRMVWAFSRNVTLGFALWTPLCALRLVEEEKGTAGSACPLLLHLPHSPEQLHGQREHYGGVLLSGDRVECLQVAELQGWRRIGDDLGSLLQSTRGSLFTFGCYNLKNTKKIWNENVSFLVSASKR